jgi:hypothetical protein
MRRKLKNGWNYDSDESLAFDHHAFESRYRPFAAQRVIAHEDYRRMGQETHPLKQYRSTGYPQWLDSPTKIKAVIVCALLGKSAKVDTLDELRARARERQKRYFRMNWWRREGAARYRALQACSFDAALLYARIVHLYGLGYSALEIARETDMGHSAVRQQILRFNRIARRLFPQAA